MPYAVEHSSGERYVPDVSHAFVFYLRGYHVPLQMPQLKGYHNTITSKTLYAQKYPDYLFVSSSAIWVWRSARIVRAGKSGGGYKLDIFASCNTRI